MISIILKNSVACLRNTWNKEAWFIFKLDKLLPMFHALCTDGSAVSIGDQCVKALHFRYSLVFYVAPLPSSCWCITCKHFNYKCEKKFQVYVYRSPLFVETSNDVFCMQECATGVLWVALLFLLFLPGTCIFFNLRLCCRNMWLL